MRVIHCGAIKDTSPLTIKMVSNFLSHRFDHHLGQDLKGAIHTVKAIYFPEKEELFDWDKGFEDFYQDGVFTLRLARMTHGYVTYFVGHEIAHLRQVLKGELKPDGYAKVIWKGQSLGFDWYGREANKAPWERSAIRWHHHRLWLEGKPINYSVR